MKSAKKWNINYEKGKQQNQNQFSLNVNTPTFHVGEIDANLTVILQVIRTKSILIDSSTRTLNCFPLPNDWAQMTTQVD